MKRVYTDPRFSAVEVVNNGDTLFESFQKGELVDSFRTWEKPDGTVSEAAAARRARDYFERLATVYTTENLDLPEPGEARKTSPEEIDAVDHTDIFNAPVQTKPISMQIDDLLYQEKMETDPERKRKIRRYLMNLMKKEESAAEATVGYLLFGA